MGHSRRPSSYQPRPTVMPPGTYYRPAKAAPEEGQTPLEPGPVPPADTVERDEQVDATDATQDERVEQVEATEPTQDEQVEQVDTTDPTQDQYPDEWVAFEDFVEKTAQVDTTDPTQDAHVDTTDSTRDETAAALGPRTEQSTPQRRDIKPRVVVAAIVLALVLVVVLALLLRSRQEPLSGSAGGDTSGSGTTLPSSSSSVSTASSPTSPTSPATVVSTPVETVSIETASVSFVGKPFETINIPGTYHGAPGVTLLRVELRRRRQWTPFPLPVSTKPTGEFIAYVQLGAGRYRLRIVDPATGTTSATLTLLLS